MNKKKWFALAGALVIVAAVWFLATYRWIDGRFYAKDAELLDLRGKKITAEHYELVQGEFPDKTILWDVPFQGSTVPHDSKALTVSALSDGDVAVMDYLEELETVDARQCTDYPQLEALRLRRPEVEVLYCVRIDGEVYSQDASSVRVSDFTREELALIRYLPELKTVQAEDCREYDLLLELQEQNPALEVSYKVELGGFRHPGNAAELKLQGVPAAELMDSLRYFPQLTQVSVTEPDETGVIMPQLAEAYPNVAFYWEKEILGVTVTSEDTQADLSANVPESIEALEAQLKSFPKLERVYLGACGLDNDALAAYRDRVRSEYKLVWNLSIGTEPLDTDATWYMPGKSRRGLLDEEAVKLKYFEDMICIDIGHKPVYSIEFVRYMPNLKYLIVACSPLEDITPLESCKNLIYLEIFETQVKDYTPLLGCTALEDLNISVTFGDPEPILQMTWLKRLHWAYHDYMEEELQAALPNTKLMLPNTGYGTEMRWRDAKNYYDMRDILGMWYMW